MRASLSSRIASKMPALYVRAVTRAREWNSVAITFDDGPHHACTDIVLRELDNQGMKATFYVNGSDAETHRNVIREIHGDGHAIGNHGYDHRRMARRSESEVRTSIMETNRVIVETIGVSPRSFRPPYGWYFPWHMRILDALGMRLVLWSMMPREFDDRVTLQEIARTFTTIASGEIIVLHTNEKTTGRIREVIKLLADSLREKELQTITLSSLENCV